MSQETDPGPKPVKGVVDALLDLRASSLLDEAGRLRALRRYDVETYTSEASFKQITEMVQLVLEMEMVSISFIAEDKQVLKARQGLDRAETSRAASLCNFTIRSFDPLVIEDTLKDARVRDSELVTGAPFLRSYIGAPLTTEDGYNLGALCALDSRPRQFVARDVEVIRKSAELVMTQLDLRRRANHDFLTELANRRNFLSRLDVEMARIRRSGARAVVAMLDIDFFKKVNDTHGHATGDRVLRQFSRILAAQSRQKDLVARLGGEEFAVLLPDTDLHEAEVWAERVTQIVAETSFDGETALRLTTSVGLASVNDQQPSCEVVLQQADTALYSAKHQGRNRVMALWQAVSSFPLPNILTQR